MSNFIYALQQLVGHAVRDHRVVLVFGMLRNVLAHPLGFGENLPAGMLAEKVEVVCDTAPARQTVPKMILYHAQNMPYS